MEIKYIKSASRNSNIDWLNKGGLDLSKEVLYVSISQRATELPAIKVGGLKKILLLGQSRTTQGRPGFDSQTTRSFPKSVGPQPCSPLTYRDPQYIYGKI